MAWAQIASAALPVAGGIAGSLLGGGAGPDGLDPGGVQTDKTLINKSRQINTAGFRTDLNRQLVPANPSIAGDFPKTQLLQSVNATDERQALVRNLANVFNSQALSIGGLIPQVAPGFGRLTDARVQSVRNARDRVLGDARDTFARRRVLGSNFAQNTLGNLEREFGQEEGRVRAQSALEELQLTVDLIGQQAVAKQQEFQTFLQEQNLQTDIALTLSNGVNSLLTSQASAMQAIAAAEASNRNNFLALAGSEAGSAVGDILGGLFGKKKDDKQRPQFFI